MPQDKVKIIGYVTQDEKDMILERARQLGMSIGVYLYENCMWENRFNLIPQLRKGGSIICNGKET
jgi:hypothetical protein